MFAELMTIVNAVISAAKIPLNPKERQLLERKIKEASQIIQTANERQIELYDPKVRQLCEQIKRLGDGHLTYPAASHPRFQHLLKINRKKTKK